MKKLALVLACTAGFVPGALAAVTTTDTEMMPIYRLPGMAKLGYLSMPMPDGTPTMGMIGLHYEMNLLPISNFYTGPGIYSAVSGNQGGFFVVGLDNDYRPQLNQYMYFDSGLFVGGGGAHSASVGGGLMLLPHIGLGFTLGTPYPLFNIDYAYVKFPNGDIKGSTILASLVVPLDVYFVSPDNPGATYRLVGNTSQYFMGPFYQVYDPTHDVDNLVGDTQERVGLMGVEMGAALGDNFYAVGKASGAARGSSNGYMDLLGGLGYDWQFASAWHFVNQVLIGAGGGGNVDTGTGILAEADTGLGWQVTQSLEPRLTIGYLKAINGNFQSRVLNLSILYHIDDFSLSDGQMFAGSQSFVTHTYQVSLVNQTLFNPERNDSRNGNIQMLGFDLQQNFDPHWFMKYRVGFAYDGDDTGGMAEGALGGGYQLTYGNWRPYADVLAGAMGGGGINTDGGAFYQTELGLSYNFAQNLNAGISYGRMISFEGDLDSNTLTVNIGYRFGELQALR